MKTFICWLLSKLDLPAGIGIIMIICFEDIIFKGDKDADFLLKMFLIATPINIILSIWATIFTYRNFDEVYSRRLRWKKSNVEKLDSRIKYSTWMFFKCLFAFPILMVLIGGIVLIGSSVLFKN